MTKRILAVDDSKTMRDMVTFTLKKAGFDVAEAEDGKAALNVLTGGKFDLIITDLNMPNMDGITLIKNVRAGSVSIARVPILILTTESDGAKKADGKNGRRDRLAGEAVQPRASSSNYVQARVSMTVRDTRATHSSSFGRRISRNAPSFSMRCRPISSSLTNGSGATTIRLHAIFRSVHSIKGGAPALSVLHRAGCVLACRSKACSMRMREDKIPATSQDDDAVAAARQRCARRTSSTRRALDRALPADFACRHPRPRCRKSLLGASDEAGAVDGPTMSCRGRQSMSARGAALPHSGFTPHSEMLQKANEPLLLVKSIAQARHA